MKTTLALSLAFSALFVLTGCEEDLGHQADLPELVAEDVESIITRTSLETSLKYVQVAGQDLGLFVAPLADASELVVEVVPYPNNADGAALIAAMKEGPVSLDLRPGDWNGFFGQLANGEEIQVAKDTVALYMADETAGMTVCAARRLMGDGMVSWNGKLVPVVIALSQNNGHFWGSFDVAIQPHLNKPKDASPTAANGYVSCLALVNSQGCCVNDCQSQCECTKTIWNCNGSVSVTLGTSSGSANGSCSVTSVVSYGGSCGLKFGSNTKCKCACN